VVSPPASAAARGPAFFNAPAAASSAFSQEAGARRAPSRTSGCVIRSSVCVDWYAKRPLSHSQPSSTSSWSRASTRMTRSSRTVSSTLHCDGQNVQTVPAPSMSHGRARNR
jgi:hypothetical protein